MDDRPKTRDRNVVCHTHNDQLIYHFCLIGFPTHIIFSSKWSNASASFHAKLVLSIWMTSPVSFRSILQPIFEPFFQRNELDTADHLRNLALRLSFEYHYYFRTTYSDITIASHDLPYAKDSLWMPLQDPPHRYNPLTTSWFWFRTNNSQ